MHARQAAGGCVRQLLLYPMRGEGGGLAASFEVLSVSVCHSVLYGTCVCDTCNPMLSRPGWL